MDSAAAASDFSLHQTGIAALNKLWGPQIQP
jgi:hypothetical protein